METMTEGQWGLKAIHSHGQWSPSAWTLCCLLDTVLAYPSLPFPVCFFLFEMLFFA